MKTAAHTSSQLQEFTFQPLATISMIFTEFCRFYKSRYHVLIFEPAVGKQVGVTDLPVFFLSYNVLLWW